MRTPTTKTAFVVSPGTQGPPGPPGETLPAPEEDMYAKRVDFVGDIIYRGEADPGSAESAAVWRIRRFTIAEDGDVKEEWAAGTAEFVHVWSNRESLEYS